MFYVSNQPNFHSVVNKLSNLNTCPYLGTFLKLFTCLTTAIYLCRQAHPETQPPMHPSEPTNPIRPGMLTTFSSLELKDVCLAGSYPNFTQEVHQTWSGGGGLGSKTGSPFRFGMAPLRSLTSHTRHGATTRPPTYIQYCVCRPPGHGQACQLPGHHR